ncbi:AAA family ATPase [Myroides sp. DF42-4-2]|uniref:McrB family protein n=1 Tax=unclassified Myroides TaxID=2642485 RepID=UPI002574C656|nr:AAA family ATPase [Myroides sp. DF42-4-2]MDM1407039.1 AAA family ATPase [Myroides sp. DF42-4-2]
MDLQQLIENKRPEITALLEKYKTHLRNGGLNEEKDKWVLFEKQKGLPKLDPETIVDELISLNYSNLLYHTALGVMKHLKEERKEQYAQLLVAFYDEQEDLRERIKSFDKELLALYREVMPTVKYGHHHDERTLSLLLSFKYPENYFLYKYSFYSRLCKLLGVKSTVKNQRYLHYLELADIIKNKFIKNDQELQSLIKANLPEGGYTDPSSNLLTQDFLYIMLEKDNSNHDLFAEVKTLFNEQLNQNFDFPIAIGSDHGADFQRLQDQFGIIGSDYVHYELYCDNSAIYIDLHLENEKQPQEITTLLQSLYTYLRTKNYDEQTVRWFDWATKPRQKKYFQSIRYQRIFSLEEEEITSIESINEMIQSFVELDKIIGHDIRDFLINNNIIKAEIAEKYMMAKNAKHPLNQILYGPPGTGKTYHTINKAIAIANPSFDLNQNRNKVKEEYKRLVEKGQIVFTTFHQSMTYEDFIEGIKPVIEENDNEDKSVIYDIQDGIFKTISKKAQIPSEQLEVYKTYTFNDAFNDLVLEANKNLENEKQLVLNILTENLGLKITGISDKGNLILKPIYSENAKEYTVSYSRAEKLQKVYPDLSVIKNIDKEFRAVIGGSNSTAYWAVLNYINNKINAKTKSIATAHSVPLEPHVLIIDEINRGNVSNIFGELITLIEEDKRLGNEEEIKVTLPYSKEPFGIPSNLYIIGTMNTADRSVEALDTALRRRFVFEEMPPKYDLPELQQMLYGYTAASILEKINTRIEKLLDRDHLIGHSYFINKNEATLIESFYKNIIPLLQEYFFGDYGKIGLVLGSGFIEVIENKSAFAKFSTVDYSQFEERESYKIIDHKSNTETFREAINLLMK